ncbi:MAG: WecB/TagA/CpsF family glycosyltransferase [Bacteroidetes bacterium]|nr:WecB/TagA/CpsF family glycosyltransferase [Bacteroidota bacterium]MBX7129922.1 WecB/TagA/CpsF family glycosyltransferase [Flavobacteriales bacterium]MCC6656445.1 WecB/TagA/CpsF family glycosyltransferase [Flavobacteriales bacterium]HMU14225.1 WecB/TagA/CpsF family glycosyltransferase [Flavobacteriales bacterium]HMW96679.1 WecB/TagA/CpsF family glycosyltransferase [Flavobacteriales bacterium]
MTTPLPKKHVLGVGLSTGSFAQHIKLFAEYGAARRSAYVCCVNAHMCVEAHNDPAFAAVVNGADFATADGMPMLNQLNRRHQLGQERVAGNDIMPALMAEAAAQGLGIYLYGGKQEVLDLIVARAAKDWPTLRISGIESPPYRPLSNAEMEDAAERINASAAHIVLVSLGCPKQEKWMAAMKGKVNAIMLGMGGAFLLYAGVDSRAPKWMRDLSLEWVYRLALEPGRLWKRYLVTNTTFLWLSLTGESRKRQSV